jgi:hypothetical protein
MGGKNAKVRQAVSSPTNSCKSASGRLFLLTPIKVESWMAASLERRLDPSSHMQERVVVRTTQGTQHGLKCRCVEMHETGAKPIQLPTESTPLARTWRNVAEEIINERLREAEFSDQ